MTDPGDLNDGCPHVDEWEYDPDWANPFARSWALSQFVRVFQSASFPPPPARPLDDMLAQLGYPMHSPASIDHTADIAIRAARELAPHALEKAGAVRLVMAVKAARRLLTDRTWEELAGSLATQRDDVLAGLRDSGDWLDAERLLYPPQPIPPPDARRDNEGEGPPTTRRPAHRPRDDSDIDGRPMTHAELVFMAACDNAKRAGKQLPKRPADVTAEAGRTIRDRIRKRKN